jgi:hypothetical protein
VACGEELTISYLDLTDPAYNGSDDASGTGGGGNGSGDNGNGGGGTASSAAVAAAARRTALQAKYLFACTCARCTRGAAAAPEADGPDGDHGAADNAGEALRGDAGLGPGAFAAGAGAGASAGTAAARALRQVAVLVLDGAVSGDKLRVEVALEGGTDGMPGVQVLRVAVPSGAGAGTQLLVS